jgi:hypothetical protein
MGSEWQRGDGPKLRSRRNEGMREWGNEGMGEWGNDGMRKQGGREEGF